MACLLILFLSGCGGGSPAFRGVDPVRVHAGGHVFDLRVDGQRAEAVRRNMAWVPRLASVGGPAVAAIEAVSRCRVDKLTGDQAMIRATLDCGEGAPRTRLAKPQLECDAYNLDEKSGELLCYPF